MEPCKILTIDDSTELPDRSGFGFCREVRSHSEATFRCCSPAGLPAGSILPRLMVPGGGDYLVKPNLLDTLLKALRVQMPRGPDKARGQPRAGEAI